MLEKIVSSYAKQVEHFFAHLDLSSAHKMEEILLQCAGKVVLVGVGKSGIIAEKLAKTLVATGTVALSMSAMDALHGDIGVLKQEDVVIFLSKSGGTEELLNLVPFVKARGATTLAWVCHKGSKLEKVVDETVVLPIEQEVCPFDLAPTCSSAVQLIFGHTLAVAIMQKKEVKLDQYAQNHPAGNIGKKIHLKVADVMKVGQEVPKCLIGTKVQEGLFELTSKRSGCVIVEDKEGKIEGVFTDGDLRRAIQSAGKQVLEAPIERFMTKSFISASKTMSAIEAMSMMNKGQKKVTVLPVLEGQSIVGLIRMHDLVEQGIVH